MTAPMLATLAEFNYILYPCQMMDSEADSHTTEKFGTG